MEPQSISIARAPYDLCQYKNNSKSFESFQNNIIFHPDMLQINRPGEFMYYVGKNSCTLFFMKYHNSFLLYFHQK